MQQQLGHILRFSCLALGLSLCASEPCLKYEPEVVELVGTMKRHVFPGPPDFESVKGGDQPETYWVLRLSKPICVAPVEPDSRGINVPETDVRLLQLNQVDYKGSKHLLGKRVKVKGRLVHAITGHHHTNVMLEVQSVEPAT
jgi:Domain of unknown function (DUF4431)